MRPHYVRRAGAEAARGPHEVAMPRHQRRAAHQPRGGRPADEDGKREDADEADLVRLRQRGRHANFCQIERGQYDQQWQEREGDDRVGGAHRDAVGPAADIARQQTDQRAERRRGQRRPCSDRQ